MNQKYFNAFSRKLDTTLSDEELSNIATESQFCQRKRRINPRELLICLMTTMGCDKTETIADIQRRFVEYTGQDITYRAMHSQLSKEAFPEFMREALSHLLTEWLAPAQVFSQQSPFSRFRQILLQDGSSFALNDSLKGIYPGRFSTVSPAAVELHATMDLLADQVCSISLTADTASERDCLPELSELDNCLLLVDRGYFDLDWFSRLDMSGGHFIGRCLNGVNPVVEKAWSERGKVLELDEGATLKTVQNRLLKKQRTELSVCWKLNGKGEFRARLIAFWNEEEGRYTWLITNLPRDEFSLSEISDAYRLRWQIELLFKEWKSYANLHRFNTSNPHLAEGLIWASVAAAVLRRFICQGAQRLAGRPLSTRRVAMSCASTLTQLMTALLHHRRAEAKRLLEKIMAYLGVYAQRAHPKRDRKTGRSKLGLLPIGCC